jgi:hypothetical protein
MTNYAGSYEEAQSGAAAPSSFSFEDLHANSTAIVERLNFQDCPVPAALATGKAVRTANWQTATETKINVIIEFTREANLLFDPLFLQLEKIEMERRHWVREGDPPSEQSLDDARALLARLQAVGFAPERVIPSAEGGIGMFFRSGQKYADFECSNQGQITAIVSDGHGDVRAFPVDATFEGENRAIAEIRAFLES